MNTQENGRSPASILLWVPLLLGVVGLAVDVAIVHRFTVDDAYITLRYSRNVARGLGPVYNATGARAEGYTSFTWMALLAVVHALRVDALVVAKTLGVLLTVATCALTFVWTWEDARGKQARVVAAVAAVAGYAVLPRTATHAVSGMETALFTLLLTAALFAVSRLVQRGVRWALPFSALALAAALTRPEASLALAAASLAALAVLPGPARARTVVTLAAVFALPLVGYELFRLRYYGLPLPLPFYVKVASPGRLPGAEHVLEWLGSELRFGVPLLLLLSSPPRHLHPVLAAVGVLVVFFLLPQHLMGYASRYLAPLDPAVCVLFGLGVGRLFEGSEGPLAGVREAWRTNARASFLVAAVLVAFVLPAVTSVWEAPAEFRERIEYADGLAAAHESLGRDLAALHARSPRVALSDAGAVPYLSDWWTLDLIGLNDARIAVTGSREPAWVLASSPDVLVLASSDREVFTPFDWNTFERPIFDAASAAGFKLVDRRRFASDYWLWVLVRPGFSLPPFA